MDTPSLEAFARLAAARRSVRAYKPDPVPEDLLRGILDVAHLAPSACNRQPWRFVVVRDESARRRLANAYSREWFWTAPVVVAVCVEPAAGWIRPHDGKSYAWVDGAIAMDHLTLAAAARAALSLPDGWEIVAMTPLGYPAPDPAPRPRSRKPLSDVLHRI